MKAGTYKGVPDTPMLFMSVFWVAHERVPKQAIYDILKLVYKPEIRKQLEEGYVTWKQLAPATKMYLNLGSPMHPGAEAYYKEVGLWEE